jgi:hypothetical protein
VEAFEKGSGSTTTTTKIIDNDEFIAEVVKGANTATLDLATHTLKTLVLINGGALVALLAFISAMYPNLAPESMDSRLLLKQISWPLVLFAYGLTASALAIAGSYITSYLGVQAMMYRYLANGMPIDERETLAKKRSFWAAIFRWICIALSIASIAFFLCGFHSIRDAITTVGITEALPNKGVNLPPLHGPLQPRP